MNHNKLKHPKEVMDFAVNMIENGMPDSYILSELKDKFGVEITSGRLDTWFHLAREKFFTADYKAERNYQDAINFNKRVANLKKEAKTGLILIYAGEIPGKTSNKPIMGEKHSVIKSVYNNFILTEDGAIQFNDVKGVLNFG